jgi:hypothetical protein
MHDRRFERVLEIHSALYTTLLILSGGLAIWALFLMATGRPVDGAYRSTYILTIGTSVAQAVVGLILYLDSHRPADSFHYLYGISLMVFTGAGYVFATRGSSQREPLVLGIASAAAVGLIWRAWLTAHG